MAFDFKQQKELAKVEDEGIFVHIAGLDEVPLYYFPQDTEEGKEIEEEPVGWWVTGSHSKRFREIEARHRKRRLKPKDMTGGRAFEDGIDKMVHCVLRWVGMEEDGVVIECTPENVRMVLVECPWVLEQVSEVMNDHKLFFENKSK